MKKQIIAGITAIACVALCAAVWPRSVEVEELPAQKAKPAVNAEIEARPTETPGFLLSANTLAPEVEVVAESEPEKIEITTEEKTEPTPAKPVKSEASSKPLSDPKAGTISVIDGERCMWIPGFGWVKDEGGGSVGISVGGEGDINKQVGVMDGGTMVGNPGDELTGHKVGIMDGGTIAEDMYENGHKIGSMGGSDSPPSKATPSATGQLEPVEGEIHLVFVEPPVKDSTPPTYKPDTTSP